GCVRRQDGRFGGVLLQGLGLYVALGAKEGGVIALPALLLVDRALGTPWPQALRRLAGAGAPALLLSRPLLFCAVAGTPCAGLEGLDASSSALAASAAGKLGCVLVPALAGSPLLGEAIFVAALALAAALRGRLDGRSLAMLLLALASLAFASFHQVS